MSKSVASLTADDFESHTDERFQLKTAKGALELKLVEVRRLGQAMREGGAFSLMFISAPGPFMPQATYPLAHPALGTIELFVVPLGPKEGGNSYEVVFT